MKLLKFHVTEKRSHQQAWRMECRAEGGRRRRLGSVEVGLGDSCRFLQRFRFILDVTCSRCCRAASLVDLGDVEVRQLSGSSLMEFDARLVPLVFDIGSCVRI